MIIHFNGFPGVGKLTVAQLVAKDVGARLLDNHMLIDLCHVISERENKTFEEFRGELQALVFSWLAKTPSDTIYVMTNALSGEHAEDVARFEAIRNLSAKRGDVFVPILLTCAPKENAQRIVSADRMKRKKMMDPKVLLDLHEKHTIVHLPNAPYALEIDTTVLTPEKTASLVVQHVKNIRQT